MIRNNYKIGSNLPQHIAFIMDGNGRWAKAHNLSRIEGHKRGLKSLMDVLEMTYDLNIPYVTLYAFSTENSNRPTSETSALFTMLKTFLPKYLKKLYNNEVRLRVIGQFRTLSPALTPVLQKAIDTTAHFNKFHLTIALNYSSRDEILDAVQRYQQWNNTLGEKLTWEKFSKYLDTGGLPDPDLVIRTSGEYRLSNFLLLQSAYSELYFTNTYWPDFKKDAFLEALKEYQTRERRFGKTSEQVQESTATSLTTIL